MRLFEYSFTPGEAPQRQLILKITKHPSQSIDRLTLRIGKRLLKPATADESLVSKSDFKHSDFRAFYFFFLNCPVEFGGTVLVSIKFSDGSAYRDRIPLDGKLQEGRTEKISELFQIATKMAENAKGSIARKKESLTQLIAQLRKRLIMAAHDISWRVSRDKRLCFYILQNPERIGHLATEPDIFFAEVLHRIQPSRFYVIIQMKESWVEDVGEVSIAEKLRGSQILKMLKRQYPVITLSRQEAYSFPWYLYSGRRDHAQRDIHGVLDMSPTHLQFSASELRRGKKLLRTLGLPDGEKYVCLHMREPGFVGTMYKVPEDRYAYRDVAAESYRSTVDWLISEGFYVVRMGVPPLPDFAYDNERFIDYPSKQHSSFADVYLCAHCEFFIGTTSGLYAVADVFRKPILFTNFAPLRHIHSWSARHLTVPKLAYHVPSQALLSFENMLLSGFGDVIHGEKVSSSQIEYLPNSADEILDAAKEVVGRIKGNWKESPEDWQLQKRFWDLIPVDYLNKVKRARVSADFLRRYHFLLPISSQTLMLKDRNEP